MNLRQLRTTLNRLRGQTTELRDLVEQAEGGTMYQALDQLTDEELEKLIADLDYLLEHPQCGREIDPTLFAGVDLEAIAPGATDVDLSKLIANLKIAMGIHKRSHS